MKRFRVYRRKLLCKGGSIYEGRWATTKREYMASADQFIREPVLAYGPWEVEILGGQEWTLAVDAVEDDA